MSVTTRNGKPLTILLKGDRRRMSDGRNAFRKMSAEQRADFLEWIGAELEGMPEGDWSASVEVTRGAGASAS